MGRSLIHPTKMGFSKGLLYNACLQVSDFPLIRSLDPAFFSCCTFGGLIVPFNGFQEESPFPGADFSGEPAVTLQLVRQFIFLYGNAALLKQFLECTTLPFSSFPPNFGSD